MSAPHPEVEGYLLRHVIGRGGAATIYEAYDDRHGRSVAVKIVDAETLTDSQRRAFTRELRAMGRLGDHPHVVTVFDSGFTRSGQPYLVMPLFPAGAVGTQVREQGPLLVEELLDLAVRVGAALETAHRRGILHCDIKPNNLLVGSWGEPMLADFGISSVKQSGVTSASASSLTLMYAAPEIIDDRDPSVASDIYSFGATLFALVEGRPPFEASSPAALVRAIIEATDPPEPQTPMPDGLRALLAQMMAASPSDRPHSVAHVIDRLQRIQDDLGLEPTRSVIADLPKDAVTTERQSVDQIAAATNEVTGASTVVPRRIAHGQKLLAGAAIAVSAVGLLIMSSRGDNPVGGEEVLSSEVALAEPTAIPMATPVTGADADGAAVAVGGEAGESSEQPRPAGPDQAEHDVTLDTFSLLTTDSAPLPESTTAHPGGAYTVDWSPLAVIATGGHDGVVRLWDESGVLFNELFHEDPVRSLAWSPDGMSLAVADDVEIRVWDLSTGDDVRFRSSARQWQVAWTSEGSLLASGGWGRVSVWDPATGVALAEHTIGETTAWAISVADDGQVFAVTSEGEVLAWSAESRSDPEVLGGWVGEAGTYAGTVRLLGDDTLLVGMADESMRIIAQDGTVLRSIQDEWQSVRLDLSPDGQKILSVGQVSTVRIVDLESGVIVGRLMAGFSPVAATSWSPDGTRAAVADLDGVVRIWSLSDLADPRPLLALAEGS